MTAGTLVLVLAVGVVALVLVRAGARPRPTRRRWSILMHRGPKLAGEALRLRLRARGDYSSRA
ncbi:MAG: hypothetical protein ABSB99_08970 [Acidimicrobiales bacterium]